MNELLKITLEALLVMIVTIIPVATKYLVNFVNVKINSMKQTTQNVSEEKILNSIEQLVLDSVNYVSQTFVDTLKKSGDFNGENQKIALTMALDNIKESLSEEAKEFIMSNYGDITSWLTTKIESTIKLNKN